MFLVFSWFLEWLEEWLCLQHRGYPGARRLWRGGGEGPVDGGRGGAAGGHRRGPQDADEVCVAKGAETREDEAWRVVGRC